MTSNAGAAARTQGQRPQAAAAEMRDHLPCLLCGATEPRTMFTEPPYRIVKCTGCGLVYTLPRLPAETIAQMYQVDYWQSAQAKDFGYTDYVRDRELYLRTYRMRRKLILKYHPQPGRVLDVGCAAGYFLKTMHEIGWQTTGVELSAHMAHYARTEMALPDVRQGMLEAQELEPQSFDVITFWDVIEHLEDPRPALRHAAGLLKPDGIIVIETQNVDSWFARIMGKRWQHYKYEEHLYHFSPATLPRLLAASGLQQVESSARRGGKRVSVEFIMERARRVHPIVATLLKVLKPFARTTLYVNLFDEIIAVARRA
ncbi:MAG: class I SAM-dependent methyltransferase [Planctomycetota bacterium]